MTTVTVDAGNSELNALLDRISDCEAEVVLERNGKPGARLVPAIEDHEARARRREAFFARIDRVREHNRDVPLEVIEAEIAEAVREVRAAQRAE